MYFLLSFIKTHKRFIIKDLIIFFVSFFALMQLQNIPTYLSGVLVVVFHFLFIVSKKIYKIKEWKIKYFVKYAIYLMFLALFCPFIMLIIFLLINNDCCFDDFENNIIDFDDKKINNKDLISQFNYENNKKIYTLFNDFFASKYFLKW